MTRCTFGIHCYAEWERDPYRVYFRIRRGIEFTYDLLSRKCERCGHEDWSPGDTVIDMKRVR